MELSVEGVNVQALAAHRLNLFRMIFAIFIKAYGPPFPKSFLVSFKGLMPHKFKGASTDHKFTIAESAITCIKICMEVRIIRTAPR